MRHEHDLVNIGSLFSGIGGLELGLEWSGLGRTVWQVEQNRFCREILAKRWPDVERFEDVKTVGRESLTPVDLICGGFPCQDISSAGKGAGLAGSRSGLWFEFARIVEELRPRWVVVENVASGAKRWVDQVCAHLGQFGYETLPVPLSAEAVGAPHQRARIFIVAHTDREQLREQSGRYSGTNGQGALLTTEHGEDGNATHAHSNGKPTIPQHEQTPWLCSSSEDVGRQWRPPVSPVCGVDDGIPDRVDRLRALGNSVVPQCAEVVGHLIRELMR